MTHVCNLGHHERIIRVGLGLLLLAIGGFSVVPGWGSLLFLALGLIGLLTGIFGYCPAWHLLGISTCPSQGTKSGERQEKTAKSTPPR